jgi:type I restriction enzyme M protein
VVAPNYKGTEEMPALQEPLLEQAEEAPPNQTTDLRTPMVDHAKSRRKSPANGGANLGFEAKMWLAADKLRGSMDSAEYKHVVLGLVFLKYISDAFQERFEAIQHDEEASAEDRDEYTAEGTFWVPKEARWSFLQASARQPTIGRTLDGAMEAIERENPSLQGVLPKDYARPALDKQRLGELIDIIGTIGLGDRENRSKDIIGRVYEYFLSQFASAEGKKGGEFYTPRCVVRLLVELIEPYEGRIYDPCCGSAGMFVQSEGFIKEHGGKLGDISIYGQESNPTTWKLAKMNLAIRGIEANLGLSNADTFRDDLHKDLRANFILANPPFNMSDWGGDSLAEDVRWKFGVPPAGNANYAWIEHMVHHLAPGGFAGFVMANGSLSAGGREGGIRRSIIENGLVDCIVALQGQFFYGSQISVCLWLLARDKKSGKFRDRHGETLFIDARTLGQLVDRTHRELTSDEITRIARTYRSWRGEEKLGHYADVPGFCRSVLSTKIEANGFVLAPGRYVGALSSEEQQEGEPFQLRLARLTSALSDEHEEGRRLEQLIARNLKELGYGN